VWWFTVAAIAAAGLAARAPALPGLGRPRRPRGDGAAALVGLAGALFVSFDARGRARSAEVGAG